MPRFAIIVAGGQGVRMGSDLPKQFISVAGRPILMYTLERFIHVDKIVLALPLIYVDYWQELCQKYNFSLPHQVVVAGETRFHTVQKALSALDSYKEGYVAVHDGVRPLVSRAVIDATYHSAELHGAALPAVEVVDSLRHITSSGKTKSVVRSEYLSVQTPQAFSLELLRLAYALDYTPEFTDDASVFEAAMLGEVAIVQGNIDNIKITSPKDLVLAEYLLSSKP